MTISIATQSDSASGNELSDMPGTPYTISTQVSGLPVSATLRLNEEVAALRAAGQDVCHMGFGESPFPVHPYIIDALIDGAGLNSYAPVLGLPKLRALALGYFPARLGFGGADPTDNFDVIVGPGSKDLLFAAQLAIEGDLMLPTPSWVSYGPQAQLAGSRAIKIPTRAANHHHLTGDMIAATTAKARAAGLNPAKIILNYPNNPSGLGLEAHDLAEIAATCRAEGLIIISDEIYALTSHGRSSGAPHQSIAALYPEGTIVTTGLSKHVSLGGYRTGFAFVPKALGGLFPAMVAVASETWSCVSHPVQHAATAALEGRADVEDYIRLCTRAHGLATNYVREALIAMGIDYPPLAGAFYLYPDFSPFREALRSAYGVKTSDDLAMDLLSRVSLAALPGRDFGDAPEVLTLRLAVTDYDGASALEYLRGNMDATPADFVTAAAPRVRQACEKLAAYLSEARKG